MSSTALVPLSRGFVYEWFCVSTGKYYIGSHNGLNAGGYIGSGIVFTSAWKKYGSTAFTKRVLYTGPNYREFEHRLLVALRADDRPDFYNLTCASVGCAPSTRGRALISERQTGEGNSFYGRTHSPETVAKIKQKITGKKRSLGQRRRYSESKTGEKNPMFGKTAELNPFFGMTHSAEAVSAIKEANRRTRHIKLHNNSIERTPGCNYCRQEAGLGWLHETELIAILASFRTHRVRHLSKQKPSARCTWCRSPWETPNVG